MSGRSGTSPRASVPRDGTRAVRALTAAGVTFTVRRYTHDERASSYGEEVAAALGVSPEQVFKTLVTDVDGQLVVAVVPVSSSLDLKALASAAGGKRAALADPATAERATGYVLGGISPLGQRRTLTTVVDASATHQETVLVSGGRRGLDLELDPADLVRVTGASVAPIARHR